MDIDVDEDVPSTPSGAGSDIVSHKDVKDHIETAAVRDTSNESPQINPSADGDQQVSSVVEGMKASIIDKTKDQSVTLLEASCSGGGAVGIEGGAKDEPIPNENSSGIGSGDAIVRIKMLARVSMSDAHFRHQQRDEPDLTSDEKIDIAQRLLDESKSKFLARFGNFLEIEDLEYFNDSLDVYEVNFYVNQIRKTKGEKYHKNQVKNRRYEAMKDLMSKGEYFSEDEMKFREPYLYEQMVGQYLTDDELHAKVDKSDLRFSTILLKHIDQLDENSRYTRTKDREEGQEEEEEDSEEEEEEKEEEMELEDDQQDESEKKKITDSQKEELKAEFLSIMQHKFLQGADKTFDYSTVDNNEAYDDLDTMNIEAEEKYFDDD